MQRIVVSGSTGAGKTTLARAIARRLDIPHVEMDALFWEADWTPAPDDVFFQRVRDATAGDAWVVDGNYTRARHLLWPRADIVIWLDFPLWVIFPRLLRRTAL